VSRRTVATSYLQVEEISLGLRGVKSAHRHFVRRARTRVRAIIGPNGAGKSSMLNCINGVTRHSTPDPVSGKSLHVR